MVDLLEIVRRHYYHPDFHGSYSIKSVLPALIPDGGYAGLDIQDGRHASVVFQQLIASDTTPDEKESLRSGLLTYCRQDTEAMVQIFDALR